jgi:hypothetical protein
VWPGVEAQAARLLRTVREAVLIVLSMKIGEQGFFRLSVPQREVSSLRYTQASVEKGQRERYIGNVLFVVSRSSAASRASGKEAQGPETRCTVR